MIFTRIIFKLFDWLIMLRVFASNAWASVFGRKGKRAMLGIKCETCKKVIKVDEPMMVFSKARITGNTYFHHCCFQEHFLFEVWNALSLGIKYESRCKHEDVTSQFNPATFSPNDVVKAYESSKKANKGGAR